MNPRGGVRIPDEKWEEGWIAPGASCKAGWLLSLLTPWRKERTPSLLHLNDFILTPSLYFILLPIHYFNYVFFPPPWAAKPLGFCLSVGLFWELIKRLGHVLVIRK